MNTVKPSKEAKEVEKAKSSVEIVIEKQAAVSDVKLYSVQTVTTKYPLGQVTKKVTTTKAVEQEPSKLQMKVSDYGFSATTSSAKETAKCAKKNLSTAVSLALVMISILYRMG